MESAVSGAFPPMFTLPAGVRAFPDADGPPAVRWRDDMTRTSRNVTAGLIVTLGLAGIARTPSAERAIHWLVVPYRCCLCGHHFFLFRWLAPIGGTV